MAHILIIEDENDLIDTWTYYLEQAGHRVTATTEGPVGLEMACDCHPDLIILDLHLARDHTGRQLTGMEILRGIRTTADMPILIASGNYTDQVDRVMGFQQGADDYLIKGQFGVQELLARVEYQLNQYQRARTAWNATADNHSVLRQGDLTLDRDWQLVTLYGHHVDLTPLEFRILLFFMLNPGRNVSHAEIWQYGWRDAQADTVTMRNNVRIQISSLRRKLQDSDSPEPRIVSIRGVGYSFRE